MYEFAKDISKEIKDDFINLVHKHCLSYNDVLELLRWANQNNPKLKLLGLEKMK